TSATKVALIHFHFPREGSDILAGPVDGFTKPMKGKGSGLGVHTHQLSGRPRRRPGHKVFHQTKLLAGRQSALAINPRNTSSNSTLSGTAPIFFWEGGTFLFP